MPRLLIASLFALTTYAQTSAPPPRTSADADQLEAESIAHPDDVSIHERLIRYYFQNQPADRVKPLRRKHIVWMIEHHPENLVLSRTASSLDQSSDPETYTAADGAWRKALSASPILADTYANAAVFYTTADQAFARKLVEDGLKLYPGNYRIVNVKGTLLAYSIAGVKAFDKYQPVPSEETPAESAAARKELELTTDPNLLGAAAQALIAPLYAMTSRKFTAKIAEIENLIPHLYQRAMALDPNSPRWKSGMVTAYVSMAATQPTPAARISILEIGLSLAETGASRGSVLVELSQAYFNEGDFAKASGAASELLNQAGDNKSDWNYGNAIHIGNIVLGRIALKHGDTAEAANRLLAAGRTPGSPQLNSFGPNWTLAQDLLAAGDRVSVLSFLDSCRTFWTSGRTRLDSLSATIRSGGTPNFSGPAGLPRDRFIGKPAPEFRLKDLKGAGVALSDFKGKVVLLDFWATWCGPCREEMPDFEKIHQELASKDVTVLALDANEPRDTVAGFIQKEKYTFPVLLSEGTDVVARYSVNAFPTTFAIDKSGRIADIAVGGGAGTLARLQGIIETARAGAPAPAPEIPAPSPLTTAATTAEDYFRDGARLRDAKDQVGAIKAFDRALEVRPDWIIALAARASLYSQLKQYDKAIADLSRVIELDYSRAVVYDQRGLAYSNSGRHAQAIPDYTRALELDPLMSVAWNNRGWAHLELGQFDPALSDLNKCIELNPINTIALMNRAHLYNRRKEYAQAIADFDAVLRVHPTDPPATAQKGEAQRLLNAAGSAGTNSLAAPKAISPADGAVFNHFPRETTLVWSEVPGAAGYVAEWDYKDDLGWAGERTAILGRTALLTLPVATFQFVGAQPGRWRVWAVDAAGNPGPKSEWREFRYTK
ncbi:MAG: tetratricopeptide repeat protein [Candidatus Sulfopaludibacter sp.]|nr:tetratricopeptide repeat protein [Candidatus Sulfopaludibacter sp.]